MPIPYGTLFTPLSGGGGGRPKLQVIMVYLNDFLHKQRGLTIERATTVTMLFGVATSAGQLVGAKIGQIAYNRHSTLQPLLMGVSGLTQTTLNWLRGLYCRALDTKLRWEGVSGTGSWSLGG